MSSSTSGTVILPEILEYFIFLASRTDLLEGIKLGLDFNKWYSDARKSNGHSRYLPPISFGVNSSATPASSTKKNAKADSQQKEAELAAASTPPQSLPHPSPEQQNDICQFVKCFVALLVERGYPISTESAIPANSSAIISDQASAIRTLQSLMTEQEKAFRGQIQLLETTLNMQQQQQLSHKSGTVDDSRMGGTTTSASSASADANQLLSSDLHLLEAKQESIKLKNSVALLQKDLTVAQREISDLKERLKESDDTIDSLEIAFAALKEVNANEKEDELRTETLKQTNTDAIIARLTKLAAFQGEQIVFAEETRARTQKQHVEELDRISTSHDALVSRLQSDILSLQATINSLVNRNKTLSANYLEVTGHQASTLATMMKNNLEFVEKQYQPRNMVVHVTREDRERLSSKSLGGNIGQALSATNKARGSYLASAIRNFPLPTKPQPPRPSSARVTQPSSAR